MERLQAVEVAMAGSGNIPLEQVRLWMKDRDMEVQGAVAHIMTDPSLYERVQPSLEDSDYENFLPGYYERCLKDDPEGRWADSRYGAAWLIAEWFVAVPADEDVSDQPFLDILRDVLARVYKDGGEDVRESIVTGVLNPVLEEARWRPYFEVWREDSALRDAYEAALAWGVEHERGLQQ